MIHLRAAQALLDRIPGLEPQAFLVGNLAPDSGIPDENWENFDPPARVTHFHEPASGPVRSADLLFFRRYLLPLRVISTDQARYSFLLGYFFHLITDNLWSRLVGLPTKERYEAQFEADPRFIWEVKRDWYGLDFEYLRAYPRASFWQTFLTLQYSEDWLDFLPLHAIQTNLDYIKQFYQRSDAEIEARYLRRPGLYLSSSEMEDFLACSVRLLCEVHRKLWQDEDLALGKASVIEMAEFAALISGTYRFARS